MPSLTKRKRQFQKCHRHAITRRFQSMKTAEVEAEAEFDFFLKIVSELYIDDDNDFEHEMSEIDDEDVEIDLLTLNIEEKLSLIKESLRRNCSFSFDDSKLKLPAVLGSIPISFLRKVTQHCLRRMSCYRIGLVGGVQDYAVKKFTRHRIVPQDQVAYIKKDYEIFLVKKQSKFPCKMK